MGGRVSVSKSKFELLDEALLFEMGGTRRLRRHHGAQRRLLQVYELRRHQRLFLSV